MAPEPLSRALSPRIPSEGEGLGAHSQWQEVFLPETGRNEKELSEHT